MRRSLSSTLPPNCFYKRLAALLLVALGVSFALAISGVRAQSPTQLTVMDKLRLKIVSGEEKQMFDIESSEKLKTVSDLLKHVAEANESFKYKSRGSGRTFFITEINGQKNEGARGRNWIYTVNGKLGNKSAGLFEIKAGDEIEWNLKRYRP